MRFDRHRDPEGSYSLEPRPADAVSQLAAEFARDNVASISALFGPSLLSEVRRALEHAAWEEFADGAVATESRLVQRATTAKLNFLINDPAFVAFVRAVTGVGHVEFGGRVYQFAPGGKHFDSWHDDVGLGRQLALSVNLSSGPVSGGDLVLRRKTGGRETRRSYGQPGDALLFRIDPELEHQVLPVEFPTPRTALAGWFATPVATG